MRKIIMLLALLTSVSSFSVLSYGFTKENHGSDSVDITTIVDQITSEHGFSDEQLIAIQNIFSLIQTKEQQLQTASRSCKCKGNGLKGWNCFMYSYPHSCNKTYGRCSWRCE